MSQLSAAFIRLNLERVSIWGAIVLTKTLNRGRRRTATILVVLGIIVMLFAIIIFIVRSDHRIGTAGLALSGFALIVSGFALRRPVGMVKR